MSKIIRKFRQQKKKDRNAREQIQPSYPKIEGVKEMKVMDLLHQRGKGSPLAMVEIENKQYYVCATEGISVGQKLTIGNTGEVETGNILQLRNIPEGSAVHSVEYELYDGGKVALTAGAYCSIENHRKENDQTVLKLPSGTKRVFSSSVRAMVGIVSGAGIKEKPLLKAGTTHYLKRSRGQLFPRVRGVAMNPVDHAFGGGNHQHIGFPSTVAKTAPYAQQVGLVGARSTGRRTGSKKK
ncbi:hypothetical protein NUSPORA_00008 [Nucleospora cyclopteri]